MTNLVKLIAQITATSIVLICTATVTAECVGVGYLWSKGMFESQKMVRLAGVLYGLDALDVSPGNQQPDEKPAEKLTREQLLADRVRDTKQISDRHVAISKGTDDIRGVVLGLRTKRVRQDQTRGLFESSLDQLEDQNRTAALNELRATLETLSPKQAKDIMFSMLTDPDIDPSDDVMAHTITVIKAMPTERMRKILGEFKSDAERALLHDIFVELGSLDERNAPLAGGAP